MRINGQNTTHLIILFCIILLSCNNKDDNKQKYNREVDLSQKSNISNSLKGKITKVIALGSNTSSVFGTISQIEFTPNDIFIFDDYKKRFGDRSKFGTPGLLLPPTEYAFANSEPTRNFLNRNRIVSIFIFFPKSQMI